MKSRSSRRCGSGGWRGPGTPSAARPAIAAPCGPHQRMHRVRVEVRGAERHDGAARGPAAARASTRANRPPRLWPISTARLALALRRTPPGAAPGGPSRPPSSRRSGGCPTGACGGRSGAATTPSVASCASPVRKPGISITGRGAGASGGVAEERVPQQRRPAPGPAGPPARSAAAAPGRFSRPHIMPRASLELSCRASRPRNLPSIAPRARDVLHASPHGDLVRDRLLLGHRLTHH